MIYSDIVEYNIVGDTKAALLRCIPFISKVKNGDIISTGQYMNYQNFPNLQFKKILKNSFHSIKLELRDSYGEKVPFNSVGVTRAVLMFRKTSNNAPIRRIAIAMNTNSAFTGHFQENPFHYQRFGLRELRIVRGGRAIVSVDTSNDCRANVTTVKAMNFNEEIPALPHNIFQNLYVLVFDLTSLQDAGENIHYPELSGESIRLEMFFDRTLRSVTELIVLGERMSTVKIDEFGTVAKNV